MSVDPKANYYDVGLETIDIIKAKVPDFQSYLLGNIIKYACRCPYKGDMLRDVEKIIVYAGMLKREIEEGESLKEKICSALDAQVANIEATQKKNENRAIWNDGYKDTTAEQEKGG